MDSRHDDKRMNVEEDRLSSLPDCLIHKILSFISIKHAIQTSVLSSRWRFIWTSMPYLNLSRDDFTLLPKFSEFVTHVLSDRNNQTEVSSVKLTLHGEDSDVFVKQIINSRSLKHLSFTMKCSAAREYRTIVEYLPYYFKATSTWDFPALTTLYLHSVTLCCDERNDPCIDLFSKCANLKDLTIRDCYMNGFEVVRICLPLLSNLTLEQSISGSVKDINIVAPQLKNLIITDFQHKNYLISAPNLVFLLYKGYHCLQPPASDFISLEKADICVFYPKCAHQVLCLLQRLHSVKFLTLSLEIVELLSSSVELLSNQPSPFANLKSLMIHPGQLIRSRERVKMSAEVRGYLLDSSPGATFTVYAYEYIRVMYNTKLAQDHIKKLRTFLEKEKAATDTKMAKIHEQGKADVDIDMSLKDLSVQVEKGKRKASFIISILKDINQVLEKLPASNRAMIQPSISTLRAEADTVMKKITDCIKMDLQLVKSVLS
ncbi:putative F-box domain, leucine-rich repeat domain superfamily, F-box-like domain superfamily [Helianthus annuus]|nr:putative F-box domain, leucine-rich repeat domain superfamily, F-box-like domain superfamily [Helianthus annuus]